MLFQVRIKSKKFSRVEENFRSFFRMLRKEVRLPSGSTKTKVSEISWPQNVVKNIEGGTRIDQYVEIRNPSERLVQPQSNVHGVNGVSQSVGNKRQSFASQNENFDDGKGATIGTIGTNENIATVPEAPSHPPGEERKRRGHVPKNSEHGTYSSINTASIRDYMSEPRSSWHQSVRPISVAVTRVRPMKPELRQVRKSVPERISTIDEQTPPSLQNSAAATSIQAEDSVPPPSSNPSGPDESASQRRQFVFPQAIAVKRDAWRYSVDAVAICDMKRGETHSSVYGEGLMGTRETREITDPEILEKVARLRREEGFKNDAEIERKRSVLRELDSFPADAETFRKIEELRRISRFPQLSEEPEDGLELETREVAKNGREVAVTASAKDGDSGELSPPSPQRQQFITNDATLHERTPTPLPQAYVPLRTPRHQSSTTSSNIRTPKTYYGPDYVPMDRVQVRVYPRETKEQYTKRGRQQILNRWSGERLQQRRKEGKGLEIVTGDGNIWQSADILLGKAKYADGPPTIRKARNRASKPPAVPQYTNGILRHDEERLPQREGRTVKIQSPPATSDSPAASTFSDLISTSTNPRQIPGLIQQFPPPPSHAIVPHQRLSLSNQTLVEDVLNNESASIRPPVHRQSRLWDKTDSIPPPKSNPMSAEEATNLLSKFIRRNVYPTHAARRHQRILESQSYFSAQPPDNEHFNSLDDMVGYIVTAYQAVDREGTHELTTLHRANILRFLVTKELVPYPAVRVELHAYLQLVKSAWPIADYLGLRPLGVVRFMHDNDEILVFLSTEDDALYLWSGEWDKRLFGGRKLVRAEKTIDDCEAGIIQGLHVLEFERGGWLKLNAYNDKINGVDLGDGKIHGCTQNGPIQV